MAATDESLVSGTPGKVLLMSSVGWGAIQTGRLVISPLLPTIQTDLGIGPSLAGLALTVMWGLYAVLQYPSGRLSDQLTRKSILVTALVLIGFGFVLLGSAGSYLVFLMGTAVVGAGAGFYPTAATALLSDTFVGRRGQALGILTAAGSLGGVLAAGLATVVVPVAPWRSVFLPVLLAIGIVTLAFHFLSEEAYAVEVPRLEIRATVTRLLRRGDNLLFLLAYTFFAFAWQATTGFLPTYFRLGKGFSPEIANLSFAILFGMGILMKPLAGTLGDRFRHDLVCIAVAELAAVSLAVMVFARTSILAIVAVVGFASGLMAFPPVMQAYLMDNLPDSSYGGDLGAMKSVYIGIGSTGPAYVGFVAANSSYDVAFGGVVCALVVSGGLIWRGSVANRS